MKKTSPIKHSVVAKNHTPQYRAHKYFARRPYNVFSNLVKHYTNKNDIVLDCFCGGGVTVFETAALGRRVIGVDINPLATFITRMQMFNGDLELVKTTYKQFINRIKNRYSNWYYVKFEDDEGICEWVEWVYVVKCPHCNKEIPLTDDYKLKAGVFKCPNQKCKGKNGVRRVDCIPNNSKPLKTKYHSKKTKQLLIREITAVGQICNIQDFEAILKGLNVKPDFEFPLDWDRQHEDKLKERGVINYRHLFTVRNYAINCSIFNDILAMKGSLPTEVYELLYFLFSSSLRYTNNMTRVTENWEGGNPTAMDKHAFWLPNQYIETNITDIIEKRAKAVLLGLVYSKSSLPITCKEVDNFKNLKHSGEYLVINRSSSDLPLADKSVDIIITDPPYGSNVQYAELSTVWNAWFDLFNGLNGYIFKDEEAVVNRKLKVKGSKTENDYEQLLYGVYKECSRVLKDGGYLVFTFNNKNIKVWIAMMKSVAKAGFYLPEDGVLFQDFIESYKNTAHLRYSGNIHGDFIYSFVKGKNPAKPILNGHSLHNVIEITIEGEIRKLFNIRKTYTTTELYQKVFSKLVGVLMAYIVEHLESPKQMLCVKEYSNDYIDNVLRKYLDYKNDTWYKKVPTK